MTRSRLKRLLPRVFLPAAVLFPLIIFTGATFIAPSFHAPPLTTDWSRGLMRVPSDFFSNQGNRALCHRDPVLDRMEEMILTQRKIAVSV